MSEWKSPVEVIMEHREEKFSNEICAYIEETYQIHVDKDRLVDALMHSKSEWQRGYKKGLIDAVKHGHFIEKDDGYGESVWECSVCGEWWTLDAGTPYENQYNYCPSCGAKMDEVQDAKV